MKVTRFLLSALFLGAMANSAFAAGAVSINWDSCVGPLNKSIVPGVNNLYASVLGHDQPHQAYQVWLSLGSGNAGAIRDAWRFDADGCQGSSFLTINHLAPAAVVKACPTFQGANTSYQLKDYSFDALTGKARTYLANTYPASNFTNVNPAVRYFLANWAFDHTYSVNGATTPGVDCGGLEVGVCIHITKTSWLTPGGVEFPWAIAGEYVTANDAANATGCPGATPADNRTWGSVKAQYKR
jgi:hypothetical protein